MPLSCLLETARRHSDRTRRDAPDADMARPGPPASSPAPAPDISTYDPLLEILLSAWDRNCRQLLLSTASERLKAVAPNAYQKGEPTLVPSPR